MYLDEKSVGFGDGARLVTISMFHFGFVNYVVREVLQIWWRITSDQKSL